MTFNQNFYASIGNNVNIENLNGTLTINGRQVLTADSDANDFVSQLGRLVTAVEKMSEVEPAVKVKAASEIRAAEREATSDNPQSQTIKGHLDAASEALKSVADVASNAFSLGKVLLEMGKWAIAIFA